MLYPKAIWRPLTPDTGPPLYQGHYSLGNLSDKNTILLHITGGMTATGAIETFKTSVHPKRTSAHIVIDRDPEATITQLVDFKDIAWHASQVNTHAIGIEHVATTHPDGQATEAQYQASAELVAWLCDQLGIPCDRAHVRTHNEASPADNHVLCCTGGLDPNRVVAMAQSIPKEL